MADEATATATAEPAAATTAGVLVEAIRLAIRAEGAGAVGDAALPDTATLLRTAVATCVGADDAAPSSAVQSVIDGAATSSAAADHDPIAVAAALAGDARVAESADVHVRAAAAAETASAVVAAARPAAVETAGDEPGSTERRRSRTYPAAGYATSPVLKTGCGTGHMPLRD